MTTDANDSDIIALDPENALSKEILELMGLAYLQDVTEFPESVLKMRSMSTDRLQTMQLLRQLLTESNIWISSIAMAITVEIDNAAIRAANHCLSNTSGRSGVLYDGVTMDDEFFEFYHEKMMYVSRQFDTFTLNRPLLNGLRAQTVTIEDLCTFDEHVIEKHIYSGINKSRTVRRGVKTNTKMYWCRNCNTRDCVTYVKQTRSADEGKNQFVECNLCHLTWQV